jgi:hypothetical protein
MKSSSQATKRRNSSKIRSHIDMIQLSNLGMLCVPDFSSHSVKECHNILPYEKTSTLSHDTI